jgi:hypothetical protein
MRHALPLSVWTLLVSAGIIACAPSSATAPAAAPVAPDAAVAREFLLTFDSPRTLAFTRGNGATGRLEGVAKLHGRLRAEPGDTLVLSVVDAWTAEGRALGLPLGTHVRVVRSDVGSLVELPPIAAAREGRTSYALYVGILLGALALLYVTLLGRSG